MLSSVRFLSVIAMAYLLSLPLGPTAAFAQATGQNGQTPAVKPGHARKCERAFAGYTNIRRFNARRRIKSFGKFTGTAQGNLGNGGKRHCQSDANQRCLCRNCLRKPLLLRAYRHLAVWSRSAARLGAWSVCRDSR